MSSPHFINVGHQLSRTAENMPHGIAIAVPQGRKANGRRKYLTCTFRELDEDSNRLANGLRGMGVQEGMRLVLMVRPGIEFISLTFALFKVGAVVVLIDPGMGRRHLLDCIEQVNPDGFLGLSIVQAARVLLRRRFPNARFNVTVGRRWFWGGPTVDQFRADSPATPLPLQSSADTPAAIIFTTGSTGPPKGVGYRHGNFQAQVDQLRDTYDIQPGEIDLPGFPLFALFNCAMGVTTVIPDMDPTRPAQVNPKNIIEAVEDWQVTQAFGSPALWNVVAQYGKRHEIRLPTLKRVLSAGAPVPPRVLRGVTDMIASDGEMFTPYGATEALPVASIGAAEILDDTAAKTRDGGGTCVGRRFSGIDWKVIRISDDPIKQLEDVIEMPPGEIGELIVTGAVVTDAYVTRTEANAAGKIAVGDRVWHRMGDVGYLDTHQRFWFCGRKAHRVRSPAGTLYTVPCEAIFNEHPSVFRSALVGLGSPGEQLPVLIVELDHAREEISDEREQLINELGNLAAKHSHTEGIRHFLVHPDFPVDIRHNSKIFREKLAKWAVEQTLYETARSSKCVC